MPKAMQSTDRLRDRQRIGEPEADEGADPGRKRHGGQHRHLPVLAHDGGEARHGQRHQHRQELAEQAAPHPAPHSMMPTPNSATVLAIRVERDGLSPMTR